MIFYQLFLLAHLTGALVLGILILKTVIVLVSKTSSKYNNLAWKIGLGSGYQLVTGSLLEMSAHRPDSLLVFCSKIGLYLAVVLIIEGLLFIQIRRDSRNVFPIRAVSYSLTFGLFFTALTIII